MFGAFLVLLVAPLVASPPPSDQDAMNSGERVGVHWRHGKLWQAARARDTQLMLQLPVGDVAQGDLFTLGVEVEEPIISEPESDPKWNIRFLAGSGLTSILSEVIHARIDFLEDTYFYGFTLGRSLWRDPWGIPLDISGNVGAFHHLSGHGVEDIVQFLLFIKLEWTKFPWDRYLRTRIGFSEGISYLTENTYTEIVTRNFKPSRRLLNYLEFSLSLNLADLLTVTRISKLFPDDDVSSLDHAWITGALHHRSGGSGLYGDFTNQFGQKEGVGEGSNYLSIGATIQF